MDQFTFRAGAPAASDYGRVVSSSSTPRQPYPTNTTYTVTMIGSGGYTGTVTLNASGLPAGATATFNPPSITSSGSSTMTVTTSSTTPIGSRPTGPSGAPARRRTPGMRHRYSATRVCFSYPQRSAHRRNQSIPTAPHLNKLNSASPPYKDIHIGATKDDNNRTLKRWKIYFAASYWIRYWRRCVCFVKAPVPANPTWSKTNSTSE